MISTTIPTFESELEAVLELLAEPPAPGSIAEQHMLELLDRVQQARPDEDATPERLATPLSNLDAGIAALSTSRLQERESHQLAPGQDGMAPTLGGDLGEHAGR